MPRGNPKPLTPLKYKSKFRTFQLKTEIKEDKYYLVNLKNLARPLVIQIEIDTPVVAMYLLDNVVRYNKIRYKILLGKEILGQRIFLSKARMLGHRKLSTSTWLYPMEIITATQKKDYRTLMRRNFRRKYYGEDYRHGKTKNKGKGDNPGN